MKLLALIIVSPSCASSFFPVKAVRWERSPFENRIMEFKGFSIDSEKRFFKTYSETAHLQPCQGFGKLSIRCILLMGLKIGPDLRGQRGEANHVRMAVLIRFADDFAIEILRGQFLIHVQQIHFQIVQ